MSGYTAAKVSKTFTKTGLPEGKYEVRVTQGTLARKRGLSPAPVTISGKTTSPYEASYRIDLSGTAPWSLRVTRVTPDSDKAVLNNSTFWSRVTEIVDVKLSYPHSALIGLEVDAAEFGDRIPVRGYEIYGRIIAVPSNYDPGTRAYTGIWDGTFKQAWTDNPAWVLYDLLTNTRYGLGARIDASKVDKWSLYEIARYCDELVPDGYGGTEPRFTFNGVIATAEEAHRVVQAVATAFRGMAYLAAGSVTAVQDAPSEPVKLVTPSNVIDGLIEYSGSALKARHSIVKVTWNDPADGYRPAVEVVEHPEAIARHGLRSVDVTTFGCTSRGQANRFGRWLIYSEQNETETATWRASWDQADLRPGQVVKIADPAIAGVRFGGRLKSATASAVVLDAPVTLDAGQTYTLSVMLPDGTVGERPVTTAPSTTDTLTLATALADTPLAGAQWMLSCASLEPRLFRVIAVREVEAHIFEITALLHDPKKYAAVEAEIRFPPPVFSKLTGDPSAPSALTVLERLYRVGPAIKAAFTVSWSASTDPRVIYYELQARRPGQTEYEIVSPRQRSLSFDLQDTEAGTWGLRVRGVTGIGQPTAWLEREVLIGGTANPPADVTDLRIAVLGATATLSWAAVGDLDLSHYRVKFSTALTGATWGSSVDLVTQVSGTSLQVPAMVGTYLVKAVDLGGVESANAAAVVTTVAGVEGLNVVELVDEAPAFAGTKTDVIIDPELGGLVLAYASDVFAETDWFGPADWFLGSDGLAAAGTYQFADMVDMGEVYTARLTAAVTAAGLGRSADWFARADVFAVDDWFGVDPSAWSVGLQMRFTNDDPAGAPVWSGWQSFIVGDYTARAFQFRVQMSATEFGLTPLITGLSVQVDMPDRVVGGEDLLCTAAGLRVDFTPAFKALKGLGIAAQDMASGDRYEITAKDETGFFIRFFNSADAAVARTFDYIAKGYGRVS